MSVKRQPKPPLHAYGSVITTSGGHLLLCSSLPCPAHPPRPATLTALRTGPTGNQSCTHTRTHTHTHTNTPLAPVEYFTTPKADLNSRVTASLSEGAWATLFF